MSKVDAILGINPRRISLSFSEIVAGKKIVIYGVGAGYHSFNQFVLSRYGIEPITFIDETPKVNSRGMIFTAREFVALNSSKSFEEFVILVTIGNRQIFNEIKNKLISFGLKNIFSTLDIYEYNLCYASKDVQKDLKSILKKKSSEINAAYERLSDDRSKEIFLRILSGHWNEEPIRSIDFSPDDQYVVDGLGLSESNISLLDCGAYDGDTLIQFCNKYGTLRSVVALECDMKNFKKLAMKQFPQIESLIVLPLGSADKTDQLFFQDDNKMQSRFSAESIGSSLVGVINCDEVFRGIEFTKVVIDTEGYEIPSINGMNLIIKNQSPDLAIAAYHYPTDFFEILNRIDSINPNYNFYLRNHSPFVAETVLYAVKK